MKILLLIFFILNNISALAQDTITYKFTGTKGLILTDWSYERITHTDSIYEEKGLFTDKSHFFKIKNGKWFIQTEGEWRQFYRKDKIIAPQIEKNGIDYVLLVEYEEILHGIYCLVYRCVPAHGSSSLTPRYWFNPEKGIIQISHDDGTWIREDIIKLDRKQ